MFTGIVEEIGKIVAVKKGQRSSVLTIGGKVIFDDSKLGDSVAVNGVCLTVSSLGERSFSADVMNESLKRSCLGELTVGKAVNLERAMSASGRFGGHMVSGHIDGTGVIEKICKDDNAVLITVACEEKIMRYIVEKGSIAIDGTSLTIAEESNRNFTVSLIPHTAKATSLGNKSIGDKVNLENDLVAKYIEKFLLKKEENSSKSAITADFLARVGF